jgi:hypothetical protein
MTQGLAELIKEIKEGNRDTVAAIELMTEEFTSMKGSLLAAGPQDLPLSPLLEMVGATNSILRVMSSDWNRYGSKTVSNLVSIKKMIGGWMKESSMARKDSERDKRESEAERAARAKLISDENEKARISKASPGGGLLKAIMTSAVFAAGSIYETMIQISKMFSKLRRFTAIDEIFKFFGKLSSGFRKIGVVDNALKTFGGFIENFRKIGTQFSRAAGLLKKLGFVDDLFSTIKSTTGYASRVFNLGRGFVRAIPKILGALGVIAKAVSKIFIVVDVVVGVIRGLFAGFKAFKETDGNFIEKLWAGAKAFLVGVFDSIIGSLVNGVSEVIGMVLKAFGFEEVGQAFQDFDITAVFESFITGFENILKSSFKGVSEFFSSFKEIWSGEKSIFSKIIDTIVQAASGIYGSILNRVLDVFGSILKVFGFEELGKTLQEIDVKETIITTFNKIKDKITEYLSSLGDMVGGWVQSLKERFNSYLPDFLKSEDETATPPPAQESLSESDKGALAEKAGYNSWEEYERSGWKWEGDKTDRAKKAGYNSWEEYERSGWKWNQKMVPSAPTFTPTPSSAGQRLNDAGNPALRSAVTVINNNGGNVSNNTTSNQTNNSSANVGPILTGSAMEM